MTHMIGDGGHAKVCRDVAACNKRSFDRSQTFWFVAVGDNASRKEEAEAQGGPWATLIHKRSYIAPSATIDEGTVIMAGVIVQANAKIGKHVILNSGCVVDHDCVIGDYAHIAPGVHLCGGVHVGEGTLVGVGVGVEPEVKIPAWSVVKREKYTICPTK